MTTKIEQRITQRVIRAREAADLSRAEVAQALSLGEQSYGHYERGRYAFTIDQLFTLSRVLGRSVEWFLGLDTGMTEEEDRLLALYRNLPRGLRGFALEAVEGMARAARQTEEE